MNVFVCIGLLWRVLHVSLILLMAGHSEYEYEEYNLREKHTNPQQEKDTLFYQHLYAATHDANIDGTIPHEPGSWYVDYSPLALQKLAQFP